MTDEDIQGDQVPAESRDQITVETLKTLVKETFEFKAKLDIVKKQKTEMEAEFKERTNKILGYLEALELENFKVPGFGNAIVQNKFSVKVPREPEEKKKLFDYLQERGQFWELVSVNSNTLNSYYKQELANAVDEGNEDFKVPGIGEPMHYQSLQMRKG